MPGMRPGHVRPRLVTATGETPGGQPLSPLGRALPDHPAHRGPRGGVDPARRPARRDGRHPRGAAPPHPGQRGALARRCSSTSRASTPTSSTTASAACPASAPTSPPSTSASATPARASSTCAASRRCCARCTAASTTSPPRWRRAPDSTRVRSASRQVFQIIEEERMRIARDMHDGPAQSMANLVLQAEILERLIQRDPQLVVRELADFKDGVRAVLEDTRRLIFDLRPDVARRPRPGAHPAQVHQGVRREGRRQRPAARDGGGHPPAGLVRADHLPHRPGGAEQRPQARQGAQRRGAHQLPGRRA